jgi:formyl-CoA transferase
VGEVQHAKAGKQKTLGVPLKLSANPGGLRRAAPTLGQHDGELKKTKTKGEKPWPERRESSQRSR